MTSLHDFKRITFFSAVTTVYSIILLPHGAWGQSFDPSCWHQTMSHFDSHIKLLNEKDQASLAPLIQKAREQNVVIQEGGRKLQNDVLKVQNAALSSVSVNVKDSPDYKQESLKLEREAKSLNYTRQQDVRHLQAEQQAFAQRTSKQIVDKVVSNPGVDQNNSAIRSFQDQANKKEIEIYIQRLGTPISPEHRQAVLDAALKAVDPTLHFNAQQRAEIKENKAYGQAVKAYAMLHDIANTGRPTDKLEYVMDRGKTPFDNDTTVLNAVAARSLYGRMTVEQINKDWAGSNLVDARSAMGSKTRETTSKVAAVGLLAIDQVSQVKPVLKNVSSRLFPEVPSPDKITKSPQSSNPPTDLKEIIGKVVHAAVKEIEMRVPKRISGEPIIIPSSSTGNNIPNANVSSPKK